MKISNIIITYERVKKQREVLKYIDEHPSKEGYLAKKAYKKSIIISILIIFMITIPLCIYTITTLINQYEDNNAKNKVKGYVSLYKNTFWYIDSSEKYEFSLEDYSVDDSYKPGENILIYLDENNNVISISHKKGEIELLGRLIFMLACPIILYLLHLFIGKKTYCKWWYLYLMWYNQEIEPYYYENNFKKITADKKFYDVRVNYMNLELEQQKLYKKYRTRGIFYAILLLTYIIFTVFLSAKYGLNNIIKCIMVVGIVFFCVLIGNCDVEMHRIKTGYYDKKENK